MELRAIPVRREELQKLPTTARPKVNPKDVVVPEGYEVEALIVGLNFPTAMTFAPDGTLFFAEGGSTWPTRPYMPARIWRMSPEGQLDLITTELMGGPRGLAYRDGILYVSIKGGYFTRILKHDLKNGTRQILAELPNGGWHEPGGPLFGPHDGLLYFGQGSVALNGVVEPAGFTVDIAKHPRAHDVPGQDVTLTGNNVWSRNPVAPYPFLVETGPFKPFGERTHKGEVIPGQKFCSTAIMRCKPDGTGHELLAWGVRNPFGMAFSEEGELYVSDNDFEEKGERAIANDPDRVWHIKNAKLPHGTVATPDWYGFPDTCADGLTAWDEKHKPIKGKAAEPFLENPPKWAGPPAYLAPPHTCMCRMDFCRSNFFGYRNELFLAQWGTMAPLNSPRSEDLKRGFKIERINVKTGTAEPFMHNREPGPASVQDSGGIERPVDCQFHPNGKSLYVLDFGVARVTNSAMVAFAHTGVLWKVTKK